MTLTSHHHAVGSNQNLSTVSGTWSYGKIALLVEAKIFSYKIIVVLCHNVNFLNSATQSFIETKENHLSSTFTSLNRENKFGCVML